MQESCDSAMPMLSRRCEDCIAINLTRTLPSHCRMRVLFNKIRCTGGKKGKRGRGIGRLVAHACVVGR